MTPDDPKNGPTPPPLPEPPADLSAIQASAAHEADKALELPSDDPLIRGEYDWYAKAARRTKIRSDDQDVGERLKYAHRVFVMIAAWLIAIISIILLQGFFSVTDAHFHADLRIFGLPANSLTPPLGVDLKWTQIFHLGDAVLLALIGTTTVNVIGLFVIIITYLFRRPADPGKDK